MANATIWSDELGRSLLAPLPDEAVRRYRKAGATVNGSLDGPRRELIDLARQNESVRAWIVSTWREVHAEVVSAADHAATEGLSGDAVRALDGFAPLDVLLALLLDEFDDGRELARTLLNRVNSEGRRRELRTLLEWLLAGEAEALDQQRVRVAILGGHQRDESKLRPRLFADSPFDVRWDTFAKKPSSGIVKKNVAGLLRHADAALIVTGMASHMLVQCAKDYAQRTGIRWRCIDKATDSQLKSALEELFPELTGGWQSPFDSARRFPSADTLD